MLQSKDAKAKERKERLRQELISQTESKWTSKKKKRLDKYIEKKLKKDERVLIFEKLAQSQAVLPSSLLQSSSMLGTGKTLTHQELQDRSEDKEVRKALDGRSGKRKRHEDKFAVHGLDTEDSQDDEILAAETVTRPSHPQVIFDSAIPPPKNESEPSAVGSALKRKSDGSVVMPKISKTKQSSWVRKRSAPAKEESDTSFDSSDSAYDSTDDAVDSSGSDEDFETGSEDEDKEDAGILLEESTPHLSAKKKLGFKDWAVKQLSVAKGYNLPTQETDVIPPVETPPTKKRKIESSTDLPTMRGPLGEDLQIPKTTLADQVLGSEQQAKAASYVKAVAVKRPPSVEEARLLLPIVAEEQPIMEAILLNPVVIICGETGSGKTTQVPQFLYESGFGTPGSENPGMIGITQPRRVAAVSMAARVAYELSLTSSRVSHQIRYDATVSPSTSIKFMTDGVLLRELANDFILSRYSVIIIDEAHERSMNTDILIGVLSRVVKLREEMWKERKDDVKPLRLIIMSATLRVSDFADNTTLFSSRPPVINVAARQHPVTIHFSRRTSPNYVNEAVRKATKIHTRLPPGGILIFLTGQNEIIGACRKLEAKFGKKALDLKKKNRSRPSQQEGSGEEGYDIEKRTAGPSQADVEPEDLDLGNSDQDGLAFDVDENMDQEDPEALDSEDEQNLDEELGLEEDSDVPMHIVPLYSLLPSEKQMRVFEPPPPGCRLVVVSTNVAETSLTIPGIRYVVDCGRAKERRYDIANGIQAFQISWVSKASAAQRAGRAGRTGPGHCYRLYSSALFEHHFEQFSTPEIQRMPIEGVVLQMKSMHIDAVVNFPFPTSPDKAAMRKAEKTLTHLGALTFATPDIKNALSSVGQITDLGRTMALFPVSPRFSRMLVSGQQHDCLPYVISIVSAMSVGDPFLYEEVIGQDGSDGENDVESSLMNLKSDSVRAKEARNLKRKAFFQSQHMHSSLGNHSSDVFKVLSVVGGYEYAGGGHKFCSENFVRPKAMEEIHKLRAQINNIVQTNFPGVDTKFAPKLPPPNERQVKILKQLLTAGFIDQVAVRKNRVEGADGVQVSTSKGVPYKAMGISEDAFIHPSSVLANSPPPDYIIFSEVIRSSRIFLKGVTAVNPSWLSALGKPSLCSFSKPLKNNVGTLVMIPQFGPDKWELPAVKAELR